MSYFDDCEDIITGFVCDLPRMTKYEEIKNHIRYNLTWKTTNGQELEFDSMSLPHIKNCINMLKRMRLKYDKYLIGVFADILRERGGL